MSEIQILRAQMESMTKAFTVMASLMGARVTRHQMCERLGVCSKTLTTRVRNGDVPSPCSDGKWLLSEIVEWESRQATSNV